MSENRRATVITIGTHNALVFRRCETHARGMRVQYFLGDRVVDTVIPILDVLLREFVLDGHLMPSPDLE